MLKKIYQLLLIILISIIFQASAYSGSDWNITLKVSGGGIYDYCIAGVKEGAYDTLDRLWDIPAPPGSPNSTYVYAYFPHPEWNDVFERFRQDIKAPDLPKEWVFEVVSNIKGELAIQWPDIKEILPDKRAVLVDIDGTEQEIDMHTFSYFTFINDGAPRRFLVRVSQVISVPRSPRGLKGEIVQREAVLLHWKKNREPDLAGYNVYRSTIPNSGYQKINHFLITEHEYIDKQVMKAWTYYYVVTAVNTSGGESGYSNEVKVTIKRGK